MQQLTLHGALAVVKQGKPTSHFFCKDPPETRLYLGFTHNMFLTLGVPAAVEFHAGQSHFYYECVS